MKKERRVTVPTLQEMKKRGEKIAMLTGYDFLTAQLLDRAGVDVILVGDTLGMVFQGHESTLPVTVDEVIYHTRAVRRGIGSALLVADLPFLSYQVSVEEAVRNAGRMLKEGGAVAVKLEGGSTAVSVISAMVQAGIPVMGHVGLAPQSCNLIGGHKVQGKTVEDIEQLLEDAQAVEDAGAFSMVIEAVPWPVAREITSRVTIPTIGIGAGPYCDGQVLVTPDLLGLFTAFKPHFVRRFAQLGDETLKAFETYVSEVRSGGFPTLDESYSLDESLLKEWRQLSQEIPIRPDRET
ncbi:MAG TPA: 3-methyl-2-oxobutanoate hydroxymethyltransferase [bacterium]|nr:3-methyl-2-oxobutanoate hydroxymethyltransferase [bacterium]HQO36310.1 3-methyl-2-oxobutanoate hydroxymethyltransferase [bacterium]